MRVGLVVEQCLAPLPGGTGRYAYEVAAALARSAPPGSTVTGWSAWHRHPGAAVVPGVRGPRRLPLGRRTLTAAWERGVGPAPRTVDLVHALPLRARPLVVGEGVSAGLVVPPDADQRAARLRLPTGGYLATLATLEPRKGLDVAIAALARPGAPALPLLVAGQPGWGGLDLPVRRPPAAWPRTGSGCSAGLTTPTWPCCCPEPLRWCCRRAPRGSGCRCWRPCRWGRRP